MRSRKKWAYDVICNDAVLFTYYTLIAADRKAQKLSQHKSVRIQVLRVPR